MKPLRVWLLLLLALLLPVRGALALAMQCSTPGALVQVQAQPASGHEHHASGVEHDHHVAADPTAHPGDSGKSTHDHAGVADKCNLCAASCAATGLLGAPRTLAEERPAPTNFPRLDAPPPNFVSGGQERPPRST